MKNFTQIAVEKAKTWEQRAR